MFKRTSTILICAVLSPIFLACSLSEEDLSTAPRTGSEWNIDTREVISGGPPKDGIPSLFNPKTIAANGASYLENNDLVVGVVVDGQPRAYPHTIADWHEVINEDLPGKALTVSYCPLTGSALVLDGNNASMKLTFGVSGLLYRNNLIMFDRQTDSHWPQMRLQCDEGELINTKQKIYPSIETSWGSWKKLYPNTVILSTDTGFNRPYDIPGSAYPGYSVLNSSPGFRLPNLDTRLPPKQRVHGVLFGSDPDNYESKVYLIQPDADTQLIHDLVSNEPILVVSVGQNNYVLSFSRVLDNTILTFTLSENANSFPFTFTDNQTGSTWNVLGEAIAGDLAGRKLERPLSFNAYWFAWAAFYPGAEIYESQ